MMPYERLVAWQACHSLALAVYDATRKWPREERYGLTAQLRRAAFSAPTNIVEGTAKRGLRELGRYLNIAVGSLAEVNYLLRVAKDVLLLDEDGYRRLSELHQSAGKLTWLLYAGVRRKQMASGS